MELVRLTEAAEEDISTLNALLEELTSGHEVLTKEFLAESLSRDDVEVWVAREEGEVIGMATLILLRKLSGLSGEVDDVVVASSARGKGVGKRLMEKIIERARWRGVKKLDLTSRPSREAANALYQKMGFEKRETNVYRMEL